MDILMKRPYTVIMVFLVSLYLVAPGRLQASNDDGLAEVLLGAGAITAGACAAVGATAWFNSPSESSLEKKAQDLYGHVYATYAPDIKALEVFTGDLATVSYQKKQELIHAVSEKMLDALVASVDANPVAYCAHIKAALYDLELCHKKIAKRAHKKNSPVFLSEMVHALEELMYKLKFLQRCVQENTEYFTLKAQLCVLQEQYEQEITLYQQHGKDVTPTNKGLQALIMEYGHDLKSAFPYMVYAERILADKAVVNEALARLSSRYAKLEAAYQDVLDCLAVIAHQVMTHPAYAQSLRDKQELEQKRALQRQQERLQAENQRLQAELAREKCRPTFVVEHEYRVPLAYVQPVTLEYTYSDCYDYDDYWTVEVDL